MTVADTSFLVAFFDADDRRHHAARTQFAEADAVVIAAEVLVETLGVLKAKASRRAAAAALDDLMRIANVEWSEESNLVEARRIYAAETRLSFVDACVVELCVRRGLQALTYDGRQASVVDRMLGT